MVGTRSDGSFLVDEGFFLNNNSINTNLASSSNHSSIVVCREHNPLFRTIYHDQKRIYQLLNNIHRYPIITGPTLVRHWNNCILFFLTRSKFGCSSTIHSHYTGWPTKRSLFSVGAPDTSSWPRAGSSTVVQIQFLH